MSPSRHQTNASRRPAKLKSLFIFCATRAGIYLSVAGWDVRDAGSILSFFILGRRQTADRPFDRAEKMQLTDTGIIAPKVISIFVDPPGGPLQSTKH